ncbi:unnamed protein product [Ceratitis capitata]|uniref:Aminopeptidase n=1 Tax=Ceratitis capitata TaxID=7213 RepID=A0A811U9K7_CERCA|nr:unnamed protein product [Ceratitis capitata]
MIKIINIYGRKTKRFLHFNELNLEIFVLLLFAINSADSADRSSLTNLHLKTNQPTVLDITTTTPRYNPNKIPRSLRLPNTTYPLSYHLHIVSYVHREEFQYNGNITIEILVRESTNEIVLHAKNLTVTAISMRELNTHVTLDDLTYTYNERANFLIIHPIENYQAFEAGQRYRLEILYKGFFQENSYGIYWMAYKDEKNGTVYEIATHFEPTSARLAFPCYDEPSFKANFTISLTHSNYYTAISNMLVRQIEPYIDVNGALGGIDGPMLTTTFHATPAISTYLVAFVISDFVYISEEYHGVLQRIFTPPHVADKGRRALKNAVRALSKFEDYFGIDYVLPKLDHIILKRSPAAMENWGLITYVGDALMNWDDVGSSKMQFDVIVQNHEIAHQWFGNLVSPQWWSYAWLNEGFATYFSYVVTDLLYPDYKIMDYFLIYVADDAYSTIGIRPMTYYLENSSEIRKVFDSITYHRAACVIKMFHHAFNQKTFVRGISQYLRKYQYSVANELNLIDELQAAIATDVTFSQAVWSKNSVRDIMLSWTHSSAIPIVSISRDYEYNTITIKQRSKDQSSLEYWWIPLNFASASAPDFQRTTVDYFMPPVPEVTLSASELGIELRIDDWLIVNKQQTGFYHVLYNDANLWLIAKQLHDNHTVIHPLNRAAIFQDLGYRIRNNNLQSVDVIFKLLSYLQHEKELVLWVQVADTILYLCSTLYGTSSRQMYTKFVRQLVKPMFTEIFEKPVQQNLTNTEVFAREKIMEIACWVDLPECLTYTHNVVRDRLVDSEARRNQKKYYGNSDFSDTLLLCLGMRYLHDGEFNAMLNTLSNGDRDTHPWYDDLIYALRCTQNQTYLQQYLNFLLGENSTKSIMDDNESMMYLVYMLRSNRAAHTVVWQFLEHNYQVLCRKDCFLRIFNRIAEYVPRSYLEQFKYLRQKIALQPKKVDENEFLIDVDSPSIGRRVEKSEIFVQKFNNQVYEWLQKHYVEDGIINFI